MATEVEIGPKGGLFIRTHDGGKKYLSQMPPARREKVLRAALPKTVTVSLRRKLGGVETATVSVRIVWPLPPQNLPSPSCPARI